MPGTLTLPAIAAKGFITTSLTPAATASGQAANYGPAMAPVIANVASAVVSITTIHTALIPSGAIAPPSKVGLNITTAALTQLTAISTAISATIAMSIVPATVAGVPAAGAAIVTQLTTLELFITTGLVLPLSA